MLDALLECVVNVSEGRRLDIVATLATAAAGTGGCLLDVHSDEHHNRSVFTVAGRPAEVVSAVQDLARATVERLDLASHDGVHPRIGVLDVVPWVALSGWPVSDGCEATAVEYRDAFARWAGAELALPCFVYGPGCPLPELRREAWRTRGPDRGPPFPHPSAGAAAVGARPLLVAFNLWLGPRVDLAEARRVAAEVRGPGIRALGLQVGESVQVSCNLVEPLHIGPDAVFDAVAGRVDVERAELVGLLPARVLSAIPAARWSELDLDPSTTIEARLEQTGLDGGS